MSKADETLAKAFATATAGLTEPLFNRMLEDQRTWLDFSHAPAPTMRRR